MGVFLAYTGAWGTVLVDRTLYLSKAWTGHPARLRPTAVDHQASTGSAHAGAGLGLAGLEAEPCWTAQCCYYRRRAQLTALQLWYQPAGLFSARDLTAGHTVCPATKAIVARRSPCTGSCRAGLRRGAGVSLSAGFQPSCRQSSFTQTWNCQLLDFCPQETKWGAVLHPISICRDAGHHVPDPSCMVVGVARAFQ